MKKLLGLTLMLLFAVTTFAQELSDAQKAKNAGNEAYRNKDYVTAIDNWEKYLTSDEEGVEEDKITKGLVVKSYNYAAQALLKKKDYTKSLKYFNKYIEKAGEEAKTDGKVAYFMAYASNKLDKDAEALNYYQKAIELGYKEDISMLYMAQIYKNADDEAKMKAVLLDAMEKYPDSKYYDKMATMVTVPMLKDAAVPFSKANELAKAAGGDPATYVDKMALAIAKFKEAIPMFEKVLKIDPSNEQASTYLSACKDNIKAFNEYKASLTEK